MLKQNVDGLRVVGAGVIANSALIIVLSIGIMLLAIPGQTLWSGLVAYELVAHGADGNAQITSVIVANSSPTSLVQRTVYMSSLEFSGHTKTFSRLEPLGEIGAKVPVRYVKDSKMIFVPYKQSTSYLDVVSALASIPVDVGVSNMVGHLFLFGIISLTITWRLLLLWRNVLYPALINANPTIDRFFHSANEHFHLTSLMKLARNVLFVLVLYMFLSLAVASFILACFGLVIRMNDLVGAAVVGVSVFVGSVAIVAAIHIATVARQDNLFPQFQVVLKEVLTISALYAAIVLGVKEWATIAQGNYPDLTGYLISVVKLAFTGS